MWESMQRQNLGAIGPHAGKACLRPRNGMQRLNFGEVGPRAGKMGKCLRQEQQQRREQLEDDSGTSTQQRDEPNSNSHSEPKVTCGNREARKKALTDGGNRSRIGSSNNLEVVRGARQAEVGGTPTTRVVRGVQQNNMLMEHGNNSKAVWDSK